MLHDAVGKGKGAATVAILELLTFLLVPRFHSRLVGICVIQKVAHDASDARVVGGNTVRTPSSDSVMR